METENISIQVDADVARAFLQSPVDAQRRLQLLLNLRLRELTTGRARPLKEIMDEIGQQAQARGLAPEILDSLLNDD